MIVLGTPRHVKGSKMNQNWIDLYKDGHRLNRIIRQLESNKKRNK